VVGWDLCGDVCVAESSWDSGVYGFVGFE